MSTRRSLRRAVARAKRGRSYRAQNQAWTEQAYPAKRITLIASDGRRTLKAIFGHFKTGWKMLEADGRLEFLRYCGFENGDARKALDKRGLTWSWER